MATAFGQKSFMDVIKDYLQTTNAADVTPQERQSWLAQNTKSGQEASLAKATEKANQAIDVALKGNVVATGIPTGTATPTGTPSETNVARSVVSEPPAAANTPVTPMSNNVISSGGMVTPVGPGNEVGTPALSNLPGIVENYGGKVESAGRDVNTALEELAAAPDFMSKFVAKTKVNALVGREKTLAGMATGLGTAEIGGEAHKADLEARREQQIVTNALAERGLNLKTAYEGGLLEQGAQGLALKKEALDVKSPMSLLTLATNVSKKMNPLTGATESNMEDVIKNYNILAGNYGQKPLATPRTAVNMTKADYVKRVKKLNPKATQTDIDALTGKYNFTGE